MSRCFWSEMLSVVCGQMSLARQSAMASAVQNLAHQLCRALIMGVQLSHRFLRPTTNKAGSWAAREGKSTVDPIRGKTDISLCVHDLVSRPSEHP
jgi:hypothetical protein